MYLVNRGVKIKSSALSKWDWAAKFRTVVGIARGLCFLHHECYPAIPHGDKKASNIVFDENMEPHLVEFGFKQVLRWSKGSSPTTNKWGTGMTNKCVQYTYASIDTSFNY